MSCALGNCAFNPSHSYSISCQRLRSLSVDCPFFLYIPSCRCTNLWRSKLWRFLSPPLDTINHTLPTISPLTPLAPWKKCIHPPSLSLCFSVNLKCRNALRNGEMNLKTQNCFNLEIQFEPAKWSTKVQRLLTVLIKPLQATLIKRYI